MNGILFAIAIIGGVGLVGGVLLAVVSHFCDTGNENERLAEISDALPGANCGACGFAGCDSYAEAVENGSAEPNLCAPGGADAAKKLSEILGVEIELATKVARVNCKGCTDVAETRYNYIGMLSCKAAAALGGGMKSCDFGGYPGGPKIDRVSKEGNPEAIKFPRAKVGENIYDFSFSGLKSAVLNYLNGAQMKGEEVNVPDVAASFQKAVTDVLVEHAIHGAKEYNFKKLAIAGGVASNSSLRAAMQAACDKAGIAFYHPSPIYCTDNAAMIGVAGYYEYIKGARHGWDLNAVPNLKLGER